jgi:hypothetical protein
VKDTERAVEHLLSAESLHGLLSAGWDAFELAGTLTTQRHVPAGEPGPVERAIRDRHIYDPIILLRAAAIDKAAFQLIAQAESVIPPSGYRPDTTANSRRSAPNAARVAAQSFPREHPARSSPEPSSRPARQTLRSVKARRAAP